MAPKDNVDLICSIGELAGAFERSQNLDQFLRSVVVTVARHMRSTVCSIYLYDQETDQLVLRATEGLSQDAVGVLRLANGEGLVGIAMLDMRPVRVDVASDSPNFRAVPDLHEEEHEAFLAVPITRGYVRVGVLVVQHTEPGYFGPDYTKALRAIASQLASTLENARLLLMMEPRRRKEPGPDAAPRITDDERKFIRGTSGSPGIAFGPAAPVGRLHGDMLTDEMVTADDGEADVEAFDRAVETSITQLEALQQKMEQFDADVSAALIFNAQLLMLMDDAFTGKIRSLIEEGTPGPQAIAQMVDHFTALFNQNAEAHIREKVQDVQDVGHRLLRNLTHPEDVAEDYQGHVVVAEEMLPSDMIRLATQGVEGIVMLGGSVASHVSVLCRSLGIPLVVSRDPDLFSLSEDVPVLVDGTQGQLFIDPDPEVVEQHRQLQADHDQLARAGKGVGEETRTADGDRVILMANINLLHELKVARQFKAEGIGLYRSEFPFIIRNQCPTEEEQYRIYKALYDGMDGQDVVVRTLDVGGDKMLDYLAFPDEENPFMGLRAIRFTLYHDNIFRDQLQAMLRAGANHDLKIMLPMVGSVDDLHRARQVLEACIEDLRQANVSYNNAPRLGVMIEVPSAVELADELAREADFLSLGTNDLVQYMLAVDRTNPHTSDYYVPHHPAVLRAIRRVVEAARTHDRPLSLCGEMAHDLSMIPFLIGVGIKVLSMDARNIPDVQRLIANLDAAECRNLATRALEAATIEETSRLLGREPPA